MYLAKVLVFEFLECLEEDKRLQGFLPSFFAYANQKNVRQNKAISSPEVVANNKHRPIPTTKMWDKMN